MLREQSRKPINGESRTLHAVLLRIDGEALRRAEVRALQVAIRKNGVRQVTAVEGHTAQESVRVKSVPCIRQPVNLVRWRAMPWKEHASMMHSLKVAENKLVCPWSKETPSNLQFANTHSRMLTRTTRAMLSSQLLKEHSEKLRAETWCG